MHEFSLGHGDWFVQSSDGIIESQNGDEELFGLSRYAGSALYFAEDSAKSMVDGVAESAKEFVRDQYKMM